MNNHLTLPPERKLSEERRREMGAVLDLASRSPAVRRSRLRRTRLALAPVMALVAVAALIFGLTRLSELAVPVVGAPTPSTGTPSSASDGATGPPAGPVPLARSIDRGPLSAAAARKLAAGCSCDGPRYVVRQVLFARHTSTHGDVVLYVGGDGTTYARAHNPTMSMGGPGGPSRPDPTRAEPVVELVGPMSTSSPSVNGLESTTTASYYRVAPEVASLQIRVTVNGRTGPWFEASMADGYAWAAASVDHKTPKGPDPGSAGVEVEDRAFDAQGRTLHVVHY